MSELFGEVKKDFSQKSRSTRLGLCTNVHAAGTRLSTAKWQDCGWEQSRLILMFMCPRIVSVISN